MTMRMVIALFDTIPDARYAVDALLLRKYDRSDIKLVAEDLAQIHDAPVPVAHIAAGALGTVVGLGAFAIPYFGPVVATAPMLGTLASVGAEEVDDDRWLVRELVKIGVPGPDASLFADSVRDGAALVLVRTRDVTAGDVAALLTDCGAVDIEARRRARASPPPH